MYINLRIVHWLLFSCVMLLTTACVEENPLNVPTSQNNSPTISGTPQIAISVGAMYSFMPTVSDQEGDSLTFSIQNKPMWADFNSDNGQLTGVPGMDNVGTTTNIIISVSDGTSVASMPSFNITVSSGGGTGNNAPTISGSPATSVVVGQNYTFSPTSSDADGDSLAFSISNKPGWADFNPATGMLSGMPASQNVGVTNNIVISVSDGKDTVSLAGFSINVSAAPNNAPSISGTPSNSVTEGNNYSFTPTASDADGDSLVFSIDNKPAWASFNNNTGGLSGTPASSNVGVTTGIVITVSDGKASASLPAFSISVSSVPNTAPTISGTPSASVTEGNSYSFTPSANDADGDSLAFSITNKPAWATFDKNTGGLSGTPASNNVGVTTGIVITVSDGTDSVSLPAFSITVESAPNNAPTISGTPSTSVTEGDAYSFVPTANDPDGDSLVFSIANKPSWANFDVATGTLSGTPGSADVGTTMGVVITVSDGVNQVSMQAFSIEVVALPVLGSASLSWNPPTTREDGSTFSDLAGYRIYYSTNPNNLSNMIEVANAGLSAYVVENLSSNTYYFAITAYDSAGIESNYSNVVSKTIQ